MVLVVTTAYALSDRVKATARQWNTWTTTALAGQHLHRAVGGMACLNTWYQALTITATPLLPVVGSICVAVWVWKQNRHRWKWHEATMTGTPHQVSNRAVQQRRNRTPRIWTGTTMRQHRARAAQARLSRTPRMLRQLIQMAVILMATATTVAGAANVGQQEVSLKLGALALTATPLIMTAAQAVKDRGAYPG
jgi:hypothetical protein